MANLTGTVASETILGSNLADSIDAGAGNDIVYGRGGDDIINGRNGDDTLYGDEGNDKISGGNGNDSLYGGSGNDNLSGGEGNDILAGGTGDDLLFGDAANDQLYGNDGNDWLTGGAGNDLLKGGAGADKFVFKSINDGTDTIADFTAGIDQIHLADLSLGVSSFACAVSGGFLNILQQGANTLVQVDADGGGDSFTTLAVLSNTVATDVTASSFVF